MNLNKIMHKKWTRFKEEGDSSVIKLFKTSMQLSYYKPLLLVDCFHCKQVINTIIKYCLFINFSGINVEFLSNPSCDFSSINYDFFLFLYHHPN